MSKLSTLRLLALPAALIALTAPAFADVLKPDFTIVRIEGPTTMTAGLSANFTVVVNNIGNMRGFVELDIGFGGTLDQTDRIVTDSGLACEVQSGADAGLNHIVHCTGAQLEPMRALSVLVQARGQSAGDGIIAAMVNRSKTINEHSTDNNTGMVTVKVN